MPFQGKAQLSPEVFTPARRKRRREMKQRRGTRTCRVAVELRFLGCVPRCASAGCGLD